MIHIITTCKGRLKHLQQTIEPFLAQPDVKLILVDYDCPEHCGDWVENAYGDKIKVVRVTDRPRFSYSEARNLGAAVLPDTAGWVIFADADIQLRKNFFTNLLPSMQQTPRPRVFYLAGDERGITGGYLGGTCVVWKDDFDLIGGYDEVFQGYGCEDMDLYYRLVLAGVAQKSFSPGTLHHIDHSDEDRLKHHGVSLAGMTLIANSTYRRVKLELMRATGQLRLGRDLREHLYRMSVQTYNAVNCNQRESFEVELPDIDVEHGYALERKITFMLKETKPT